MSGKNENSFRAWVGRAEKRRDMASVVERLLGHLAKHPEDNWVRGTLAETFCSLRQHKLALHHLAQMFRRHPQKFRAGVYRWAAHVYENEGNFAKAERCHAKAVASEPNDATWIIFQACFYSNAGRLTEAEELLHRATRCEEGAIDEAYLNLALIYRSARRYAEAETAALTALSLSPDYAEARRLLRDVRCALKLMSR